MVNSINRKIDTTLSIYDTGDFSFQGIGQAFSVQSVSATIDDDDIILTDFDLPDTGTVTQDDDVILTDLILLKRLLNLLKEKMR